MRLLLDVMSGITQSTGASCLILAHQGKPAVDMMGRERHRQSYAIRGASAIEDAATNIFYLHKHSDLNEGRSDPNMFRLKCRKYKGIAPDFYYLLRNPENKTHRLIGGKGRPNTDLKRERVRSRLLELKTNEGLTVNEAVAAITAAEGISEQTIWRYLKE